MRKLLTLAASAAALAGASVASAAITPVTFTGELGAGLPTDTTTIPSSPVMGGDSFTITMEYDDVSDSIVSATIMIEGASDDAEIIRASIIDVASSANAAALDSLEFDLVSTEGDLAGNFSLDFEFINTALNGDSLGSALSSLTDMGALICSHITFNFGGFKFKGTLDEGGITFNPVGEVPIPGAAIFMLSGLAAAGVARRRRQA